MASILREIYKLRESDPEELESLELDEFRLEVEQSLAEMRKSVDDLLRDQLITPHMATSLLNDSAYAEDVSRKLLSSAQAMLASHDVLVAEAEEEIMLDQEELEKLAASDAT